MTKKSKLSLNFDKQVKILIVKLGYGPFKRDYTILSIAH